jgi:hypothetical protein
MAGNATADPMVVVSSSYNQAGGYIEWEVAISKNNPSYTGVLAVELPIQLTSLSPGFSVALRPGSDLVNAGTNQTWYYNETAGGSGILLWNTSFPADPNDHTQNVGFNPFTMTVTEGLVVNTVAGNIFASLGSAPNLPNPVPTLHIASADGKLEWIDAIVAEDGVQFNNIDGMVSSVTPGDMNGNGMVSVADDLTAFTLALGSPALYSSSYPGLDGAARGDVNNDGSFDGRDLAAFVPEPGTAALLMFALTGCFIRRRQ